MMISGNSATDFTLPIFCDGHAKFTESSTIDVFRVQGETITLKHDPDVFPPSAFGLKFAEHIDFTDCQSAADIGTGTGLLAILAAKKGAGEVKATDVSPLAVRLTYHNASAMNAIDFVETQQGHYFCDFTGPFDVITANLPQEIIPPAYRASMSTLQSQAIDGGGVGGNAILLDFLDVAPRYMHSRSKLYVIVNTVTDYKTTVNKITETYSAELIWEGITRAKSYVRENINFFRPLNDCGVVDIMEDDSGNWCARQFIYKLRLPLSFGRNAISAESVER